MIDLTTTAFTWVIGVAVATGFVAAALSPNRTVKVFIGLLIVAVVFAVELVIYLHSHLVVTWK